MTMLQTWLAATQLIGWTLVHFLWQATALGLLYALARPFLARGVVRYRFGVGVLFALAWCPLVTLWCLLDDMSSMVAAGHGVPGSAMPDPSSLAGDPGAMTGVDALLPWLVLAWLLGVLLHSVRAWRQWRALKAVVRLAEQLPRWQRRAADMARDFGLHRRITVLGSRIVAAPVLIGWLRPVILVPMAVLCGFPASQIELMLAHELAHLRRWDPLVNLFQVALETAHFHHPVVRWISRDVTNEREICCDQLALARSGGSRREFVTMLAALGEVRVHQHRLLLAANGGQLLERAELMMLPSKRVARARKGAYAMAFVSCAAVLMVTARLQRLRAEMAVGADAAISQLQALVLPASIALAKPGSAWAVPDVVRIPFASATLVAARLENGPPRSLAPPKPISLPGPAAAVVPDLRLGGMQVPILRMVPATAAPAVATDAPVPVRVRQPVYPPGALSRGIEGHVVLEFRLDEDGSVRDLRRISSTPAGVFDEAALDAMRFWKYATPNGAASRRYRQILSFTLGGRRAASKNSTTASARDIQARRACQIPTGTHICRWPDDADSTARLVVDGSRP